MRVKNWWRWWMHLVRVWGLQNWGLQRLSHYFANIVGVRPYLRVRVQPWYLTLLDHKCKSTLWMEIRHSSLLDRRLNALCLALTEACEIRLTEERMSGRRCVDRDGQNTEWRYSDGTWSTRMSRWLDSTWLTSWQEQRLMCWRRQKCGCPTWSRWKWRRWCSTGSSWRWRSLSSQRPTSHASSRLGCSPVLGLTRRMSCWKLAPASGAARVSPNQNISTWLSAESRSRRPLRMRCNSYPGTYSRPNWWHTSDYLSLTHSSTSQPGGTLPKTERRTRDRSWSRKQQWRFYGGRQQERGGRWKGRGRLPASSGSGSKPKPGMWQKSQQPKRWNGLVRYMQWSSRGYIIHGVGYRKIHLLTFPIGV